MAIRDFDLGGISLGQMTIFLAVASAGSITAASKQLHQSVSSISKNIASLEKTTGLILFRRESSRLVITPAGEVLQARLRSVNEYVMQAVQAAHSAQAQTDDIQVGILDAVDPHVYLLPAVGNFRERHPEYRVRVEFFTHTAMAGALQSRAADVVFAPLYYRDAFDQSDILLSVVMRYPLQAIVAGSDPLARRSSITLDDLKCREFVTYYAGQADEYAANVLGPIAQAVGHPLRISKYVANPQSFGLDVFNNGGVCIGDKARKDDSDLNLVHVDIEGTESGAFVARHRSASRGATLFFEEAIRYWRVLGKR